MKKPLWHQLVKAAGYLDGVTGSRLLLSLINSRIKDYGAMSSITIDAKNRSIVIQLELKGESLPIEVKIQGYSIEPKENGSILKFSSLSFSREWMDAIARNFLTDRSLALPVPPDLLDQIL